MQIILFVISLLGWLVQPSQSVWFCFSVLFVAGLLLQIFVFSPYQHAKKLQSGLDDQSRRISDKAFELLKGAESHLGTFQGLYIAGAADFVTNQQVVIVADQLAEHHEHPMRWIEKYVPQKEWLSFLQWGKRHPDLNFGEPGDGFKGVVQWAVKHHRGTEESVKKWFLTGGGNQGRSAINSSSDQT